MPTDQGPYLAKARPPAASVAYLEIRIIRNFEVSKYFDDHI